MAGGSYHKPRGRYREAFRRLAEEAHTSPQISSFSSSGMGEDVSESTLAKAKWVQPMVENWVGINPPNSARGANIWCTLEELDSHLVLGFIRVLAIDGIYDLSTIKSVIMPAVKHLMWTEGAKRMSTNLSQRVATTINGLIKHPGVSLGGRVKNPALIADVANIISKTPDGFLDKAKEASLFLTACSTGARAVTVSNVYVTNIVDVRALPRGLFRIVLLYNVTKGNRRWNHKVTLEGYIDSRSNTNVVYWMNQFLITSFSLDLKQYTLWDMKALKGILLWGMSTGSMQYRFGVRAQQAGYPEKFFKFHDLR